MINPEERLKAFQAENNIFTKGPLSLVVQFTRLVQDKQFPLNSDDFQTSSKGQVFHATFKRRMHRCSANICPAQFSE